MTGRRRQHHRPCRARGGRAAAGAGCAPTELDAAAAPLRGRRRARGQGGSVLRRLAPAQGPAAARGGEGVHWRRRLARRQRQRGRERRRGSGPCPAQRQAWSSASRRRGGDRCGGPARAPRAGPGRTLQPEGRGAGRGEGDGSECAHTGGGRPTPVQPCECGGGEGAHRSRERGPAQLGRHERHEGQVGARRVTRHGERAIAQLSRTFRLRREG